MARDFTLLTALPNQRIMQKHRVGTISKSSFFAKLLLERVKYSTEMMKSYRQLLVLDFERLTIDINLGNHNSVKALGKLIPSKTENHAGCSVPCGNLVKNPDQNVIDSFTLKIN